MIGFFDQRNISDRIIANEKAHTCLTSTETEIAENLVRYNDDRIRSNDV